jgi:hypothetical protein
MDKLFYRGKDVRLRFFIRLRELQLNAKTWSAKLNSTKYADDVNGEDRSRPGRVPNFWEFQFSGFQRDVLTFNEFLFDIANDDAQVEPFIKSVGILVKMIDGTKAAYLATEVTIDDPEINQGGRTEAVMLNGGFRARYFKPVKAA